MYDPIYLTVLFLGLTTGKKVNIRDFPYQLSLQAETHFCGATIISEKFALTAAHCTHEFPDENLSVVAGISNLNQQGQRVQVARVHQHPKFDRDELDYDVSVLELSEDIIFDDRKQPIRLVPFGSDPIDGTPVVVTGWRTSQGQDEADPRLQVASVRIIDRKRCRDQYSKNAITDLMVCAASSESGVDACQGDSGGPLVANGQLVGIVSWGYGCARPEFPGVYTNVGAIRDFVTSVIGY